MATDSESVRSLCAAFQIDFPLFQAGMGGVAGPELAAAVSAQGCAGIVGLYRASPAEITRLIQLTQGLTSRSFGVNLIPELVSESFLLDQVTSALSAGASFFSFYGLPPRSAASLVRGGGRSMLVMVGSVRDAHEATKLGAAAVALQGTDAGGHLLGVKSSSELLEEALASELPVPLVVSGGVARGSDLARTMQRGASGALCGTMFVPTHEAAAHEVFKERVVRGTETVITNAYELGWPGRRHRVLPSHLLSQALPKRFIAKLRQFDRVYPIPRYSAVVPTRDTDGLVEELVMYAGESVARIRDRASVASVLRDFIAESRRN